MTPELAAQWLAYVMKADVDQVHEIGLTPDQLVTIGTAIQSANVTLIPDRPHIKEKRIAVACACGCGEVFIATYRTKRPKFKNEAHRRRYWRNQAKATAEAAQRAQRGTPASLIRNRNGRGFKVARA